MLQATLPEDGSKKHAEAEAEADTELPSRRRRRTASCLQHDQSIGMAHAWLCASTAKFLRISEFTFAKLTIAPRTLLPRYVQNGCKAASFSECHGHLFF